MSSVVRPIFRKLTAAIAQGLGTASAADFSPLSLFAAGEPGVWFDPSDLSTLFQDSAGTTPVTAAGQPVGRMLDKSGRGNHVTQSTDASRPTLQQDANGCYYLAFDGGDSLACASGGLTGTNVLVVAAVNQTSGTGDVYGNKAGNTGYRLIMAAASTDSFGAGNGASLVNSTVSAGTATNYVLTGLYDGTNVTARLNMLAGTPVAVARAAGSAGFTLGKAHDFAGSFFVGRLYQLIARGAASSTAQIEGAERFAAKKAQLAL